MRRYLRFIATIPFVVSVALPLAGEDMRLTLVPWKVAQPGREVDAPLTLFWIPASAEELHHSPLLTSAALLLFSSRCVAMRVVRIDDRARLMKLEVGAALPVAVLIERGGAIVGRVEARGGSLMVSEVESLVREALNHREEEAERRLDEAQKRAEAQDIAAAAAIYRSIAQQRCTCPRQARDAGRALKKLRR